MNAPTLVIPSKTRERVLVGMPLYDKPEWETSVGWEGLLLNPRQVPGVELVPYRARHYSAGTGRNLLIAQAKHEKCSRILFIDHDMRFHGQGQVARILSHDVAIVGAVYPKRNAQKLELTCAFKGSITDERGLREAYHVGAGFLSVHMSAVARIESAHPELLYVCTRPDMFGWHVYHLFGEHVVLNDWSFPQKKPFPQLMLEDIFFCHIARSCGIPVFADTRCPVGHIGTVDFLDIHRQMETLRKSAQNPPANTPHVVS